MDMHRWAAAACLGLIDRGYFQNGKHRTAAACLGHAAEDRDTAAQPLPPDAPAATFPRRPSEGLLAAI